MNTQPFKLFTLLFLLLFTSGLRAQDMEGGDLNVPTYGGLSKADKLYNALGYHDAIPLYEAYLKKHEDSARTMCRLGDCYRLTSDFEKAKYWYGQAISKDASSLDPKYKLYYAQMLQATEDYEDAAKWYANYIQSVPEDKRADNQLKSSADYASLLVSRSRYDVHDLSFNTGGYDFAPAWTGNGLIYSSSKDSAKAISRQSTWTGTQFFDMYFVEGEKRTFGKPRPMRGDAATKYHEANASYTPDKKQVYFTRNNFYKGKTGYSSDKVVKLDIYRSETDSGSLSWKNDQKFEYDNDEYSVGHPALSADGNTLYFASDMPGGYGGPDIYVTKKEGDKWGTPQNLGPEVNTEGYEMFPYVDDEGVLYFASDGHGGLGGLDNFRVKYNETTKKWGKLKNIGAPINSSYDDFGYIYGKDKSNGYFTSNRPKGKGSDDIYSFEDFGVNLDGIVVDAKTGEPICSSSVKMIAKLTNSGADSMLTECDGQFEFNVLRNLDYCFAASADGYIPNNAVCASTKGLNAGETVHVRIPLQKKNPLAVKVLVRDKQTKLPIAVAKVTLSGCDSTQEGESDEQGLSCYKVRCECDFTASANAKGYLPGSSTGSTIGECEMKTLCGEPSDTIIIELEKITDSGRYVELKDIYYDFDKWNIRKESETQLKILLGFLNENPDAIVEIASHTDARAPSDYNIRLSQKRAQSVVDWLTAHGIQRSRLKPKGYGETIPINGCTDGVKCSEYEHQRNRRTEFRVLGGDIDIRSMARFDMQVDPCKLCPF